MFEWHGVRIGVLLCADAWNSQCWELPATSPKEAKLVDCWCIVAESISEEHGAAAGRDLWHHMMITRAFEYGAYVAVSDWAAGSGKEDGGSLECCGVAGFVDPTAKQVTVQAVPSSSSRATFTIDLPALTRLRARRESRHFLSTP